MRSLVGLVYGNLVIDQIRAWGNVNPGRVLDALAAALRQSSAPIPADALSGHRFSAAKPA